MAKQDLRRYAYEWIKKRIVYCDYKPGSILNEQILTEEMGISRTPIREALNRLEQDGLVRIMPKKGVFVQEITVAEIAQLYQARIELEPIVVRLAGPNLPKDKLEHYLQISIEQNEENTSSLNFLEMDSEIHRFFLDYCNNHYFIEMIHKILDQNIRIQISTNNKFRLEDARDEHIKVLDALLKGEYEQASEYMKAHLLNCRECANKYFMNW